MAFELQASQATVDLWTDVRLPFEPRGDSKEARDRLRVALAGMQPTGELTATYTAEPGEFCDLENVLLYNVGMATFARLGERRLLLRRRLAAPGPAPSGLVARHHHHYTTTPTPELWRPDQVIAERQFVLLPRTPVTTASVWLAARRAAGPDAVTQVVPSAKIGISVSVEVPSQARFSLGSALKGLLDGIVCSFHRHDGSGDLDLMTARVAARLGTPSLAGEVRQLLISGSCELGVRRLLHPWGESVQWNPADDGLVLIDAHLRRSDVATPRCHAKLLELSPTKAV